MSASPQTWQPRFDPCSTSKPRLTSLSPSPPPPWNPPPPTVLPSFESEIHTCTLQSYPLEAQAGGNSQPLCYFCQRLRYYTMPNWVPLNSYLVGKDLMTLDTIRKHIVPSGKHQMPTNGRHQMFSGKQLMYLIISDVFQ